MESIYLVCLKKHRCVCSSSSSSPQNRHIQWLPTCARSVQTLTGLFFWFNWCFIFSVISPFAQREIFSMVLLRCMTKAVPDTPCVSPAHHSQTLDWLTTALEGTCLERRNKTLSPAMLSLIFLNWKLNSGLYLSLAGHNKDVFVMLWVTVTCIKNKILSTTQAARQSGIKASPATGDPVLLQLCTFPTKSQSWFYNGKISQAKRWSVGEVTNKVHCF